MAVLKKRFRFLLIFLLFFAGATLQANAAENLRLQEQEIKAGLLYNFLKYTQWPVASTFLTVCVYGEDPFEGYLKPIAGRTVNRQEIKLRTVRNAGEADSCNLLFVSAGEIKQWPQLHDSLAGKPVLTVGDSEGFAETGGMLEFGRKSDHISVFLNMEAVKAAHLQVQDRLLKLVTIVHPGGQREGQ